jgi:hypothetical protein
MCVKLETRFLFFFVENTTVNIWAHTQIKRIKVKANSQKTKAEHQFRFDLMERHK